LNDTKAFETYIKVPYNLITINQKIEKRHIIQWSRFIIWKKTYRSVIGKRHIVQWSRFINWKIRNDLTEKVTKIILDLDIFIAFLFFFNFIFLHEFLFMFAINISFTLFFWFFLFNLHFILLSVSDHCNQQKNKQTFLL
jgi:hypothetical protein